MIILASYDLGDDYMLFSQQTGAYKKFLNNFIRGSKVF